MTTIYPSAPLTARQRQVLQFVAACVESHGYPPTLREIAAHLQVSGPLPVSKHLAALEKKGYLKRDSVSRGIALTMPMSRSVSLPVAGTVRAGHLAPAVEDLRGTFAVDQLAVKGEGCFFLAVSGDSMIEAGIFEGDLALVRPQVTADNGDTVVAMVEGAATLKKFFREPGQIRLQPANAAMAPIIVGPADGDITLIGKVIGVYRRLE
jgi:repressor LexA